MRQVLWLLALVVLVGCASTSEKSAHPLSVDQIASRHQSLDGRRVLVRGWLRSCERWPFVCRLSSEPGGKGKSLAFDSPESLRSQLTPHLGREVVVEATLDAFCLQNNGRIEKKNDEATISVCLDAATDLKEPKLIAIH